MNLFEDMKTQSNEFLRRYLNVKTRLENSDKVLSEIQKQVAKYKEEMDQMKNLEEQVTVENYQKLVEDFNHVYDHYKMHKHISKKLKIELSNSNDRERAFIHLLK